MHREHPREEPPSWLGPVTALLILLVLAGLAALLWLTVFAESGAEEEHAGIAPAIVRLHTPA